MHAVNSSTPYSAYDIQNAYIWFLVLFIYLFAALTQLTFCHVVDSLGWVRIEVLLRWRGKALQDWSDAQSFPLQIIPDVSWSLESGSLEQYWYFLPLSSLNCLVWLWTSCTWNMGTFPTAGTQECIPFEAVCRKPPKTLPIIEVFLPFSGLRGFGCRDSSLEYVSKTPSSSLWSQVILQIQFYSGSKKTHWFLLFF